MPVEVATLKTVFVALTDRAKTRFHFDLNVEELLGNGTENVKGDREKWVLWQLRWAHKFAFQLQRKADEEAVERGEWEECARGTVYIFNTNDTWHSGSRTLMRSTRPEALLIFHYALAPLCPSFQQEAEYRGRFRAMDLDP
jgi:hypothetical protein